MNGFSPSDVRKCTTLGACPGGLQYGVGTADWLKVGNDGQKGIKPSAGHWGLKGAMKHYTMGQGVPTQACWGNFTPHFAKRDGGPIDTTKNIERDECFMTTKFIQRTGNHNLQYELKQGVFNGTLHRCLDQVGSRCCPGNSGMGCETCCVRENSAATKHPSCNRTQWHNIETGEGGHCDICPDAEFNGIFFVLAGVCCFMLAPIIARVSELARHAGAAQGPVLSVMNFFQSSDLFQVFKILSVKAPNSLLSVFCRRDLTFTGQLNSEPSVEILPLFLTSISAPCSRNLMS